MLAPPLPQRGTPKVPRVLICTLGVSSGSWLRRTDLIVQHYHRKGRQLIVTSYDIYGHRTHELLPVLVSDLKPSSVDAIVGMNVGKSARASRDTSRLEYGFLNVPGGDYACIGTLHDNIIGNIWEWGWNCPDEGMVMRIGFGF